MSPAVRLSAFGLLLLALLLGARLVGAQFGPVTSIYARPSSPGSPAHMAPMHMGPGRAPVSRYQITTHHSASGSGQ